VLARLVVKLSGQHALPSAQVMTLNPTWMASPSKPQRLDHKSLPVVSDVSGRSMLSCVSAPIPIRPAWHIPYGQGRGADRLNQRWMRGKAHLWA
jgi:hypothetical protein